MTAEATIRITGQADVSRMRSMVEELRKIADGVRAVNRETKASGGATVGAGAAPGAVPASGAGWAEWQAYNRASPVPWAPVSGMVDEEARERRVAAEQERQEARAAREAERKRSSMASRAVGVGRAGLGYGMMGLGLLGLGGGASSVSSWLFQSGQEHLEQSKAIEVLEHRLGRLVDIGDKAEKSWWGFGYSLGYVNSQMAGLAEAYGAQVDTFTPASWREAAGFGRMYGLDPHANMANLGSIGRYAGGERSKVDELFLLRARGQAGRLGMGGGRFGEHMQTLAGYAPEMFRATGGADLNSILALGALPGMFFRGEGALGEAGRGEMGRSFVENLQHAVTGSDAARTILLRSMGYGREGGPGYIEAEKRLEAGIYGQEGAQNFIGLMGSMKGMSRAEQAAAFKQLNPSMPMWQIEKLVDVGRSKEFDQVRELLNPVTGEVMSAEMNRAMEGMTPEQRALFEKMGWAGAGTTGVSEGEWMDVRKEGQRAEQGADMAQTLRNINVVLTNLRDWLQGATGQKLGESMEKMTSAIVTWSERFERYMNKNDIKEAAGYVGERLLGGGATPFIPPREQGDSGATPWGAP